MNNPFFSILVPVYNVSNYLDECVNSLLAQTFGSFEIILLDDGSTDDSGKKCDDWQKKDNRIRVIHRENKGLFTTRLDELEQAKGEYVVFVDSDDYIAKNTLEFLYGHIEKYACDVVTYGRSIIDAPGQIRRIELNVYENEKIFVGSQRHILLERMFKNNDLISIWSKCVKRTLLIEYLSELRKYEGVNFGEDKIFTAAIFGCFEKLVYTDEPLYFYRWNADGMSSRSQVKYFPDIETCRRAVKCFVENCECQEKITVLKKFWNREWYGALYLLKEYLRLDVPKSKYKELYKKTAASIKQYGTCPLKYKFLFAVLNSALYSLLKKIIKLIWPV